MKVKVVIRKDNLFVRFFPRRDTSSGLYEKPIRTYENITASSLLRLLMVLGEPVYHRNGGLMAFWEWDKS